MRYCAALICAATLSAAGPADVEARRAWHHQERFTWSSKTGLPVTLIERLWRTTSNTDDDDDESIETVQVVSPAERKHVLFVTAGGNGHCLTVYVFSNTRDDSRLVWELDAIPGGDAGICHEQMLPYPTAYALPSGEIVVQVPTGPAWVKREEALGDYPVSTALDVYTFRWDGATYRLASTKTLVTYKSQTFSEEKCTFEHPCP